VNFAAGRLYLKAQDTKTNVPRTLTMTEDLRRVLEAWRQRCEQKWLTCPWICHRGGVRLQSIRHAWRKGCERVGLGKMVEDAQKGRKVWQGKIPHDFRRSAIKNMTAAGIPEKVAMAISGHKTRSVYDRYNIVSEADLDRASERLEAYLSSKKGTISGTVGRLLETTDAAPEVEAIETVGR
jgi:hypothetical protein